MNVIAPMFSAVWVERVGWALLHFVWQGSLIAAVLAGVTGLLRNRPTCSRYLAGWVALVLMAACVPCTALLVPLPMLSATPDAAADRLADEISLPDTRVNGPPGVPQLASVEAHLTGDVSLPQQEVPPHIAAAMEHGVSASLEISRLVKRAIRWCVGIWMSGVLAISLRHLGGWAKVERLCRHGTSPAPKAAQQMLDRLLARLPVRRPVRLVASVLVRTPAVIGWLRPVLLLPVSILGELSPQQLEMILAHELAHIRRSDYLLNLVQTAIETLLFYHPAVWWVSRQIRAEREISCDQAAVTVCGDRLLYARALTRLAELEQRAAAPASLSMAADGWPLLTRIRRVLGLPVREDTHVGNWLGASVGALLLIGGLVAGMVYSEEGGKSADFNRTASAPLVSAPPKSDVQAPAGLRQDKEPPTQPAETKWRQEAIHMAVIWLKGQQKANGGWAEFPAQPGGASALVTLALLEAGVPANDGAIVKALDYLHPLRPDKTYSTALQTMVFSLADPKKYAALIEHNARWLEKTQQPEGGWSYPGVSGDNSNTHFAMLGLDAADRAGVNVSKDTWQNALRHWTADQNADGSWGYHAQLPGTGSMTCGGISAVSIAARHLDADATARGNAAVERAFVWLGRNFSVRKNPGTRGSEWLLYYLHAMKRAATLAGREKIAEHDWYREGANYLLQARGGPLGDHWGRTGALENDDRISTAFALMFLSRAEPQAASRPTTRP